MKRVLLKIGTKILTTDEGKLDLNNLRNLVIQVCKIKQDYSTEIIIVSSGSITCGSEAINIKPVSMPEKQACASIGQLLLMKEYAQFFEQHGHKIGQILLTKDIIANETQTKNVQNTVFTLLHQNVIPIINENDSVATDAIQFGDNDILSSLIAPVLKIDALILLTDQNGVYDDNPTINPHANIIESMSTITDSMIENASDSQDSKSKGGIKSKLIASKYALDHGIPTVIANGRSNEILIKIFKKEKVGTWIKS